MAVTIWTMRLERPLTGEETHSLLELLPPDRRERLDRLQLREKREEVLCAYGLLAWALREQYGWQRLPEICLTERGKPRFPGFPSVHFSLSHTEGAVLVGISDCSVGVDMEKIRPVSERMLRRFSADTHEAFFKIWVRREARGKCSGEGIGPMLHEEPPLWTDERYFEIETIPGYAAGFAGQESDVSPVLRMISLEELLQ